METNFPSLWRRHLPNRRCVIRRVHNQSYIALSVGDALTVLPVSDTSFFRSDNASNYKSTQAFNDIQEISNKWGITVVRVYGLAVHGKGEVDSCGGHMKTPVRKYILKGNNLRSVQAVTEFLTEKYDVTPIYHVTAINEDKLNAEREKRVYVRYDRVTGSDFKLEFEKCSYFQMYVLSVGKLSKKHLQPAVKIAECEISIVENTVFTIRADNDISNFFLLMCDVSEKKHDDPSKPLEDDFGHKIYDGCMLQVATWNMNQ